MSYSVLQDLLYEFSESELAILTGDPTGTTIDEDRVNAARLYADRTIDSYLEGIYNVPFVAEAIPPLIVKLSADLTIVNLFEIAYKNSALPNTIVWRRIYGIKMLKDLRIGKIAIMDLEHSINPPESIKSNKTDNQRIFSDDVLDQFMGG
jgi:phage gp36-like protein